MDPCSGSPCPTNDPAFQVSCIYVGSNCRTYKFGHRRGGSSILMNEFLIIDEVAFIVGADSKCVQIGALSIQFACSMFTRGDSTDLNKYTFESHHHT